MNFTIFSVTYVHLKDNLGLKTCQFWRPNICFADVAPFSVQNMLAPLATHHHRTTNKIKIPKPYPVLSASHPTRRRPNSARLRTTPTRPPGRTPRPSPAGRAPPRRCSARLHAARLPGASMLATGPSISTPPARPSASMTPTCPSASTPAA